MYGKRLFLPVFLCLFGAAAHAQDGQVTILSPEHGATLDPMGPYSLVYEVLPGPRGDHVHIYVDDKEVGILRALEGSYELSELAPGDRNLCIKVVNRAHVPVGVEGCVQVRVPAPASGGAQAPTATPSPAPRRGGY